MATSPIYSWPEPDNTDLVKNGALAIRTLGNAIDTTMATMVPKTIVDAKGDLIAGTAADTAARLAVGNNGETLVADSSTATGLRYQVPVNSNPVLNSSFQVWQRGTSGTITSGIGFPSADRWNAWTLSAGGSVTVSRQVTGDTTNLPFIQYCARVQRVAGNTSTSTLVLGQAFETVNSIPYAGKTVTVSFYARKGANYSSASDALILQLLTNTTTDSSLNGMFSGAATPVNAALTLTSTWQRFTATGTIASSATQLSLITFYNGVGTAGANDYFEITGIQLEVGSVATPFKTIGTYQQELAACQRYYYAAENLQTFSAYSVSTSYLISNVRYPVTMRTTPSISIGSNSGLNYVRVISSAAQQALTVSSYPGTGQTGFSGVYAAAAPFTASIGYDFYITASAEL